MTGRMMPKKVSDQYFCEIIRALNECDIVLQKSPRIAIASKNSRRRWISVGGLYQDGQIVIRNRPDRENMVLTLIHEALHHIWQDIPEYDSVGEAIDLLSHQLFCQFSTNQLRKLAYYLN